MTTITNNNKTTVIGLGQSGTKIIESLMSIPGTSSLNAIAIDTDNSSLDANCTKAHAFVADLEHRKGLGCGGNAMSGEGSLSRERKAIGELIEGSSLLIVTGGLGGGLTTGGARIIASIAKQQEIPMIFIMTMPFTFEGHGKKKIAKDGAKELLPFVDILIPIPNDLLYSSLEADTPVNEAFLKADQEVARSVLGVSEVIRCKNFISADFASFRNIFHDKQSTCSIGIGSATTDDGDNKSHIALERLLESSLLGGVEELNSADALFVTMIAGSDLQLGDMKKTFEAIENMAGNNVKMIVGANTDPAYNGQIQITAITVKFAEPQLKTPEINNHQPIFSSTSVNSKKTTSTSLDAQQLELPLQNISKGIFAHTTPSLYNGEDIDIPTFQRKNIIVDQGH